MSGLPILARVLINTARGNAKIWGNVSQPRGSQTGSLSFAPIAKMLQTKRGSVADPGDTVIDLGDRYVLGYYSTGVNDSIFRMYRTPFSAQVTRMLNGKDPVTGLDRTGRPTSVGLCWFDQMTQGLAADFGEHKRTRYRLITGFELQINDMVGNLKITCVTSEQGITIAEAE